MIGQEVFSLFDCMQAPSSYQYEWNALSVSSGVYLYILRVSSECETFMEMKKCIVIK